MKAAGWQKDGSMNQEYNEIAIIMTGYAASEAALEIMERQWETLIGRYPANYLNRGKAQLEGDLAGEQICSADYLEWSLGDGVFGSLWRLGEQLGCGMTIELSAIPIRQIAIEMCDFADISPYEAKSAGAAVLAAANAGETIEELKNAGVNAAIIGYTNNSNDRVVVNGEIRRFLNKSKG